MAAAERKLQIAHDPHFQKLVWRIQPLGWMIMVSIVLAGLLGLFGGTGPLSFSRQAKDGISVRYERFPPYGGASEVRIDLAPEAFPEGTALIAIDTGYLERMRPLTMVPAPLESFSDGGRIVYSFALRGGPGTVLLTFQPTRIGSAGGTFTIQDHALEIRQMVYP